MYAIPSLTLTIGSNRISGPRQGIPWRRASVRPVAGMICINPIAPLFETAKL
jgi:hypothetical protein